MYVFRKQQPPLSALDHIALAVEIVMKLKRDPDHIPTRADVQDLGDICTALAYALTITAEIKRELEGRVERAVTNRDDEK